ncbi:2-keto-4-pentenoate hydratase/2-oxohepta-3-ene-1,7-dioic acid hydratase (catechol pathway) [Pseudarthrobacter enclensis]|uniref:Fumarylacetoacetase-like C-terminal domain-containing protein n=1 Tax=Pseudarthrobacter enclensis TaxID=993070 RepID=A0A0V8I5E5_9MICC|nr:fumarylacetoacetate hydrolase family protein [Pseudarthrobacter enclensis]KSU70009.1 hypothetical protein AS031_18305 [Pseudarthrobacter enclensis]SCC30122.1 2-keto-4-pentenoate hydratase/2-oxohepta-3-ene-1,7-dioic acid hydratase (catechol pathway) [Pseudarthrobacter enclensis]
MKLGRIAVPTVDGEQIRVVAVEPEAGRVVDLARAYALTLERTGASASRARELALTLFPGSLAAGIASGDTFLESAHAALAAADDASTPIEQVEWRAAIDPPMIRDGLTFATHIENYFGTVNAIPPRAIYERPGYFKGSTATVYGPEQTIPFPDISQKLDYELEIGYVIGRSGRNLTPDEAMDHVFGVTIFSDWSLRDVQSLESSVGMGPQHSKDFAFSFGPWITTLDEIESIEGLRGQVRVNGEVRSNTKIENFVYTPEELVAFVSVFDGLQAGDIIGSGTMGFGAGVEIGRFLELGDVVELELEGVGVLRNTIATEKETPPWWPAARTYPFEGEQ